MDRAAMEMAVEDFGASRVLEGLRELCRRRGVSALRDDALAELLARLEADQRTMERYNARNRAIRADDEVSAVVEHRGEAA